MREELHYAVGLLRILRLAELGADHIVSMLVSIAFQHGAREVASDARDVLIERRDVEVMLEGWKIEDALASIDTDWDH